MSVTPSHCNSGLGRPIRVDSPAASSRAATGPVAPSANLESMSCDSMSLLYRAQVYVLLPLLRRVLMHLEVVGQENVPRSGPVILAANHPDNWDPYISNLAVRHRA